MHPNKIYLVLKSEVLNEIKLRSLALPSKQRPMPGRFGYTYIKPYGIEFWISPGETFSLKRDIVYQLEDQGAIKVIEEIRGDLGYEGNRFIVQELDLFKEIFNRHDKGQKIIKKLESEGLWVQANFEGEEIHLFVGDKKDDEGRHTHLIIGKSGVIRVDEKDQSPSDLISKVVAITTKDGQEIEATLQFKSKQ